MSEIQTGVYRTLPPEVFEMLLEFVEKPIEYMAGVPYVVYGGCTFYKGSYYRGDDSKPKSMVIDGKWAS